MLWTLDMHLRATAHGGVKGHVAGEEGVPHRVSVACAEDMPDDAGGVPGHLATLCTFSL